MKLRAVIYLGEIGTNWMYSHAQPSTMSTDNTEEGISRHEIGYRSWTRRTIANLYMEATNAGRRVVSLQEWAGADAATYRPTSMQASALGLRRVAESRISL